MKPKKPNLRSVQVVDIIELSPHLRRIIFTGESLEGFPIDMEGTHVKVFLPSVNDEKSAMRSYTIRFFNPDSNRLALDFVVNRHIGPATCWAKAAQLGDCIGIAGPGLMKITNFSHHSYLLVGDLTSVNAINGFVPRFNKAAEVRAIICIPTRADIIEMDYDDSRNTCWFIEDEAAISLEEKVL
nr:siderophore-interacting protein [Shewanella donghaensis]